MQKTKSKRNKTLTLSPSEYKLYSQRLIQLKHPVSPEEIEDKIVNQDLFLAADFLPDLWVDLMIVDPPYNLTKNYNGKIFRATKESVYSTWTENWVNKIIKILKPDASIYVCCDWRSSNIIYSVLKKYFIVQNRITWEREKGRGAKRNWKNCSEDIWFATVSNKYYFNPDAVKLKKRVIAPYRDGNGKPKDWYKSEDGNYRLTYPSNLWTDITIPFWSMPENTPHPTQKPEKLIAKLILASSKQGDIIFDPFAGSGTTAVVAKKLNRRFCTMEIEKEYCLIAEKRIEAAKKNKTIQGYSESVFLDRNLAVK